MPGLDHLASAAACGGAARLNLLGNAQARVGAQVIDLPERLAVLLALLALGGALERSRAAAWLYPGAEPSAARRNLRQTLHQQRALLGPLLVIDAQRLRLRDEVAVDVHAVIDADAPGADDPTPPLAPLLGEQRYPQRPEFQAWLELERGRVRRLQLDRLAALAGACERAGQLARALQLGESLLAVEPTSEHAHRRLMRLHYLRGDRAAALAAFDRCERVLKDELSVRPATETLDLLRMIDAAEVMATAATGAHGRVPVALLRPPRNVGREAERQALARAWADGLAFLVQGEAGIGKSRLLEDHLARHPGALLVRARHGDARRPYATLGRLLRELPGRTALASAHQDLLGLLASGAAEAGPHDEHATLHTIRDAVMAALLQAQVHPVLDDLHLADAATLDLLLWLATEAPANGLHWGYATRPYEVPGVVELRRALADGGRLLLCQLQPLDGAQVAELLATLRLPPGRAADLAPTLARRGGGNPMFTLELLKGWFSQPDASDPEQVPVPPTIALLLDQQIAACTPRAATLARLAALAATDFSIEMAEAVLGEAALALADAWRELEDRQLMRQGAFAHDLIHEAAARSVPPAIAAATHARIAAWLAAQGGPPANIATHWLAAGMEAQAVEPLCQAARQAIAAGCINEAGQRYSQAAAILQRQGDADAAFERYFDACEMHVNAAGTAAYDAAAAQAIPLARTPQQRVRARLIQAFGMYMRGDLAGSAALFPPLLDEAIAVGERRTEAECRLEVGRLLLHEGRLRECLHMVAPTAAIFHELGLPARELVARIGTAHLVARAGLETPSRPLMLTGLHGPRSDQLGGLDRRVKEVSDWIVPARIAANAGDFKHALALIDEVGDDCATQDTLPSDRYGSSATALSTLIDLGRHGQALELLRRLDERKDPYRGEWWHYVEAERAALWHVLGRPDLGQHAMRQLEAMPVHSHQVHLRLALLGAPGSPGAAALRYEPAEENLQLRVRSALALLGSGPAARALAEIGRLDTRLQSTGYDAWRPALHALQALRLAELADDRRAAWAGVADEAEQALVPQAMPATVAQSCIWLARARKRCRDVAGARRIAHLGRDWLMDEALPCVPALFHESFLQRNPVHHELLRLAQQA